MAKVMCRPEGLKGKGKLKKGYRWAKGRKRCPIKVKAKSGWTTSKRARYTKTRRVNRSTAATTRMQWGGAKRRRRAHR